MELLIVIGVLGILAAGLMAAIDPFEQLKKARDTNNRNATVELMSSITRFYANHGAFPWNQTTPIAACDRNGLLADLGALGVSAMSIQNTNMENCITGTLVAEGELKDTYMTGIGDTDIWIASDPLDSTDLYVCFSPEGKSNRADAMTKYLVKSLAGDKIATVTLDATCPGAAGCAQCFE